MGKRLCFLVAEQKKKKKKKENDHEQQKVEWTFEWEDRFRRFPEMEWQQGEWISIKQRKN